MKNIIVVKNAEGEIMDIVGPFATDALVGEWSRANKARIARMDLIIERSELSTPEEGMANMVSLNERYETD